MSARLFCDECDQPIDRDGPYFGVNRHNTPVGPEPGPVDGEPGEFVPLAILSEVTTDEDFHACSPRCLGLWAMRVADEAP